MVCRSWRAWVVLTAVLAATFGAPRIEAAAPFGGPVAAPAEGAWFGAYHQQLGPPARKKAAVESLETRLGRRLAIDHYYVPFFESFPGWREPWDFANGRVPLISWGGVSTTAVNAGTHDPLIRQRALAIKALGKPLLLEWFWEMDGNRNRPIAVSPASFISAWRRIHGIFEEVGVTNAAFVWCPNSFTFRNGEAPRWYPGDQFVDWICANGFNWAPGVAGADWRSFEDTFQAFYAWASLRPKPLLIGEYGVQERAPGEKATWLYDAWKALKFRFPAIKAVVHFNSNRLHNWRMGTSPLSFAAFRAMAQAPYFNPGGLKPPPPPRPPPVNPPPVNPPVTPPPVNSP
jgi:hypothetical protein